MTVQPMIPLYNETFKFIMERYGSQALLGLWEDISEQWCHHLDELAAEKGMDGLYEYWGGGSGTLAREQADFEITYEDGVHVITMYSCPSVGELFAHGLEPMHGELTYCDHCEKLYAPVVAKYGINLRMEVEYAPDGRCTGRCKNVAYKEK